MYKHVIAWGKLLIIVVALHLSACTVIEAGELVGAWQDEDASFITCGDTFTLTMSLDIREDSEDLRGTLSMGDTDFPFVGTRTGRIIKGDVSDAQEDILLIAQLVYSGGLLRGTFEAAGESDCATGETSKAVYQVNMTRIQEQREN